MNAVMRAPSQGAFCSAARIHEMERRTDPFTATLINAILIEKDRLGIHLRIETLCQAGISFNVAERIVSSAEMRPCEALKTHSA
jgi:hypothetical protein